MIFPNDGSDTPGRGVASKGERTLSQLLKLHAENGAQGNFSAEEASRVAEVLGQWVSRTVFPPHSSFLTPTWKLSDKF